MDSKKPVITVLGDTCQDGDHKKYYISMLRNMLKR